MQLCENTADLEIVGIGKLECRPIVGTANSCYVPWEVRDLRIVAIYSLVMPIP